MVERPVRLASARFRGGSGPAASPTSAVAWTRPPRRNRTRPARKRRPARERAEGGRRTSGSDGIRPCRGEVAAACAGQLLALQNGPARQSGIEQAGAPGGVGRVLLPDPAVVAAPR